MENYDQKFKKLLEKYNAGQTTAEETSLLESWYNELNEQQKAQFTRPELDEASVLMWAKIQQQTLVPKVSKLWYRFAAAAVILIVFSVGALLYLKSLDHLNTRQNLANHNIIPGSNKAVLILANGSALNLSSTKTGVIVNAKELSYSDGTDFTNAIADYTALSSSKSMSLQTPNGGTYQINLSDGTKVWLNAASTLKFPSDFAGLKNREVELDGEAYFEVAKNKTQPFKVKSRGQVVEVTGTHFNINCYSNEPSVKTTLLEGSVNVNEYTIKPGQQSMLSASGMRIFQVDTDTETAWKDGEFVFNGEDLESIMRKVSRWYDVDVVYQSSPKKLHFDGEILRSSSINAVLKTLEETGDVKFKTEGRTILIK
jgi:transmembrane sensor